MSLDDSRKRSSAETDRLSADAPGSVRMTSIPKLAPVLHDAVRLQQAAALRAPQVLPHKRTKSAAGAISTSTELLGGGDAEMGTTAGYGSGGGEGGGGAGAGAGAGADDMTAIAAAPALAAAAPQTASARSRATAKAFQMTSGEGRGTRQPYVRPQSASSSAPSGAAASAATAAAASSGDARSRGRSAPPPANAVHLALAGTRLRPVVGRPGPKGSLESAVDHFDGNDHHRESGQGGGRGGGGGHAKGRWIKSGPVLGTGQPSSLNGGAVDGSGGGSGGAGWRASGPIDEEAGRRLAGNGGRAEGKKWWGRVRIRTPALTVFRNGSRGNNDSGRTSHRNSRPNGPAPGFPSTFRVMGIEAGRGASESQRCDNCELPRAACMCNVVEPIGHGGPQRRPSALRTKSGRLKM